MLITCSLNLCLGVVGTTDTIFILRQIQEKYIRKNRNLYFTFADLEKAFNKVPRKVLWWTLRKIGLPEWVVGVVQIMYQNARSRMMINNSDRDMFKIQLGVHQGSVLGPLLFIIVLEALSKEFRTGCLWELLYGDDLVIVAHTMDKLLYKLGLRKKHLEAKGLRVNMENTKIMICGKNLRSLKDSGKYPCGVVVNTLVVLVVKRLVVSQSSVMDVLTKYTATTMDGS